MIVLVCGSRTFTSRFLVAHILASYKPTEIVTGDATGADSFAKDWADDHDLVVYRHKADWDRYGKSGGPIRNQAMLEDHPIDLVLAFIDKPLEESKGSYDMVRRATQAGKHTRVISLMESEFNK